MLRNCSNRERREYNFEDFEFYLNEVKSSMEQQAKQSNISNIWETELEGRKATDVLKERTLNMVISNSLQLQKAEELGIVLDEMNWHS